MVISQFRFVCLSFGSILIVTVDFAIKGRNEKYQ